MTVLVNNIWDLPNLLFYLICGPGNDVTVLIRDEQFEQKLPQRDVRFHACNKEGEDLGEKAVEEVEEDELGEGVEE